MKKFGTILLAGFAATLALLMLIGTLIKMDSPKTVPHKIPTKHLAGPQKLTVTMESDYERYCMKNIQQCDVAYYCALEHATCVIAHSHNW